MYNTVTEEDEEHLDAEATTEEEKEVSPFKPVPKATEQGQAARRRRDTPAVIPSFKGGAISEIPAFKGAASKPNKLAAAPLVMEEDEEESSDDGEKSEVMLDEAEEDEEVETKRAETDFNDNGTEVVKGTIIEGGRNVTVKMDAVSDPGMGKPSEDCVVTSLKPGGQADRAGIKAGWKIVAVNGKQVWTLMDFGREMNAAKQNGAGQETVMVDLTLETGEPLVKPRDVEPKSAVEPTPTPTPTSESTAGLKSALAATLTTSLSTAEAPPTDSGVGFASASERVMARINSGAVSKPSVGNSVEESTSAMGSEGILVGGGGDDGDVESDHDIDSNADGDVSVGASERSFDKSVGVEASTPTREEDSEQTRALRELQRKQEQQHNQVVQK